MSKYLLPAYMIIGGVKCGTSSLYRYLNVHPAVLPCKSKEPNYFSFRKWHQIPFSYSRYKRMFPMRDFEGEIEADWLDLGGDDKMHASRFSKRVQREKNYITGEATATTFFAAKPGLIKFLLPEVKLIMMIRNPTDRYVSHYRMYERFKKEGRTGYDFKPLDQYIEDEISLHTAGKKTRILHQGLFAPYLSLWKKAFGDENMLLLRTADFEEVENAQVQMDKICNFLGLSSHDFRPALQQKYNRAKKGSIPSDVKKRLEEFYEPSLRELSQLYDIEV